MKIPKKINILGTVYKVYFAKSIRKAIKKYEPPAKDVEMVGYCSTKYSVIIISKDLSEQTKETVFIHEILEAINDVLDLDMKHDNIDRLEVALYQVFKQNKVF